MPAGAEAEVESMGWLPAAPRAVGPLRRGQSCAKLGVDQQPKLACSGWFIFGSCRS